MRAPAFPERAQVQIEIKSQGIATFWRELTDNADATSAVIAVGATVLLSYGLWTIGHGIARARRVIRSMRGRATRPKVFESAEPVVVDAAPVLAGHWRRIEGAAAGTIKLAGEVRRSHEELRNLLDALDYEIAELIAEVAPVSTYAAGRIGQARPTRTRPPTHGAAARRPIAA
jgi:hypothetical protein